jgi:hypothetical protein
MPHIQVLYPIIYLIIILKNFCALPFIYIYMHTYIGVELRVSHLLCRYSTTQFHQLPWLKPVILAA